MRIEQVHLGDESGRRFTWCWGWVAVDCADNTAVGIVVAHKVTAEQTAGKFQPFAVVKMVYARRHSGLGVRLLEEARDKLAATPWALHRSGHSTPKGRTACLKANLPLDPRINTAESLDVDVAVDGGREYLRRAAERLGVDVIA
ncbi:hypothetical protein [Nocardia sp. NPDC059239]|uniref:hypothetical protein n=1 Tax=Nocardia sp. NPDC059239 TaxID=3346785 RepID=UPI0036B617F3